MPDQPAQLISFAGPRTSTAAHTQAKEKAGSFAGLLTQEMRNA
jgi:hypothetical protein